MTEEEQFLEYNRLVFRDPKLAQRRAGQLANQYGYTKDAGYRHYRKGDLVTWLYNKPWLHPELYADAKS